MGFKRALTWVSLNVYTDPEVQIMLMDNNSLNRFITAFDDAYAEFQRLK